MNAKKETMLETAKAAWRAGHKATLVAHAALVAVEGNAIASAAASDVYDAVYDAWQAAGAAMDAALEVASR